MVKKHPQKHDQNIEQISKLPEDIPISSTASTKEFVVTQSKDKIIADIKEMLTNSKMKDNEINHLLDTLFVENFE